MLNCFEIKLALKHPNPAATKDLSFKDLINEIKQAKYQYNEKKANTSEIEIIEVTNKTIFIVFSKLDFEEIKHLAKELSYFSRILKKEFRWSRYSSDANRLFTLIESQKIPIKEYREYVSAATRREAAEYSKKQCIDYSKLRKEPSKELIEKSDEESLNKYSEEVMLDEEMTSILSYIVKFQTKGSQEAVEKKKQVIKDVKILLSNIM